MTEPPTTEMPQPEHAPGPGVPPRPVPPPHHAGWAVAALLFFWPLSFSAFSHAFNVYPLWAAGDFAGAQYASERVRRLGQLSLWIFGGLLLVFAILYAISLIVFFAQGGSDWGRHGMDYAAALRLATTT
jgi:hypothetical protein